MTTTLHPAPDPTTGTPDDAQTDGVRIELSPTGDVRSIRYGGSTLVNQYLPGLHDQAVGGLTLRRRGVDGTVETVALVGSRSTAAVGRVGDVTVWRGSGLGASWLVSLHVDTERPVWVWRVAPVPPDGERTAAAEGARHDLAFAQDLALSPEDAALSSEPYVCQYLAHRVLADADLGHVLVTRQTMTHAPALPLAVTAIAEGSRGYLTDGFQYYGLDVKAGAAPAALASWDWPDTNLQYEFTLPSVLSREFTLDGPRTLHCVSGYDPDRRGPLTDTLPWARGVVERAVALADVGAVVAEGAQVTMPVRSVLAHAPLVTGAELTDAELLALGDGTERFPERDADGLLSYFTGAGTHVVRGRTDLACERPHGHILKAGDALVPTDDVLSTTSWIYGVFASQVVLGNTTANRAVSVHRNHLNLLRSNGLRLLVRPAAGDASSADTAAPWQLLGLPSAFVLDIGGVHWVYRTPLGQIDVRTTAAAHAQHLVVELTSERPLDVLATVAVDLADGAWSGRTADDGHTLLVTADAGTDPATHYPGLTYAFTSPQATFDGDGALFTDGVARGALVTATAHGTDRVRLAIGADLTDPDDALAAARVGLAAEHAVELAGHRRTMTALTRGLVVDPASRLAELDVLAPWYAHDTLIHFLVPHGLEQYSGAAWGTRDVCQGPVEAMLAAGRLDTVRDVLLRVFARQLPDGTFPQWFMFDAYAERYNDHAHGDVVVWPLFALVQYLEASGDLGVLEAPTEVWDPARRAPAGSTAPLRTHVERLLHHLEQHTVDGTSLPAYGEGDWDDTLQPAQPGMREHMSSAWTTALEFQALRLGERLLAGTGHDDLSRRMGTRATALHTDFEALMVRDGVVAGYVALTDGVATPIIHPDDDRTGITYRLIPMTRSVIAGMFDAEEADRHAALVETHLHFPDGVRLMDVPARFADGEIEWFVRAEQAANVGREVGLMYTHAHIRYVESLARLGRAQVGDELLRISPVGMRDRLPTALPRQRSCYYSSSDANFPDRYAAAAGVEDLRAGRVATKGGWRVYSSGPGIYLRQLFQGLLGLVERAGTVVFDPNLTTEDDGLALFLDLAGARRRVVYRVERGRTSVAVRGDGVELAGVLLDNPYRTGGLEVSRALLDGVAELEVLTPARG
ncbi:hypothetical protein AGMMS50218_16300 [Actinomycetota bacterium]|nr:hypothetical protein AGMMS50218_16300 [Actinomycetota bacterium]